MYGNANNRTVGFNAEAAVQTLKYLDDSFRSYWSGLDRTVGFLAGLLFDVGGRKMGMGGPSHPASWYAPEAVTFDTKVLTPTYLNAFNRMHDIYSDTYYEIEGAITKWATATGTHVSIPKSLIPAGGGHDFAHAKNADVNGNIRIDPNLANEIIELKREMLGEFENYAGAVKGHLRSVNVFLGAGQQAMLIAKLGGTLTTTKNDLINLYDTAISEVQKAIEKYQMIAKAVANSFNN